MKIFQPDRHLLEQFVAQHAPQFHGNVLDVGGGTRRYAGLFKHCTYTILDVDAASKPDIVASAESIPSPDASFDGVVCTQVLGDVWDVPRAIQEMLRVLKPGGLLLVTESFFNEEHDAPNDYWRLTRYAWQKLLAPHCDLLEVEARGGYWTSMAQNTIRHRILRHKLYDRPLLGKFAHIWATIVGKRGIARDRKSNADIGTRFTIGFNIFARKKP